MSVSPVTLSSQSTSKPSLAKILWDLDGAVTQDSSFEILVTNRLGDMVSGSVSTASGVNIFGYRKPSEAEPYGSLSIDGQKHVFSHNNYAVLRGAFEKASNAFKAKAA